MIRVCQYCGEVYGEKEPLSDKSETTGNCDLCHSLWTIWFTLFEKKMAEEPAQDWILECRQVLVENGKDETIRKYLVPESHSRMEPDGILTGCRQAKASSPPSGVCAMSAAAHGRKDRCAR